MTRAELRGSIPCRKVRDTMNAAYREDFLQRQIRALASMLARIAGLRLGGKPDEARAELGRAWQELEGAHGDLLRRLDPASAATLLDSPERILAAAELTLEDAALEENPSRSAALSRRAVALAVEAKRRSPRHPGVAEFIARHTPTDPA